MSHSKQVIYLAGFFDTRQRLRLIRDKIKEMGYEVLSSWLSERPQAEATGDVLDAHEKYRRYAKRDLTEIEACDLIIVDTIDVTKRGGREVEYGYAGALGKKRWIVGPTRNVFHFLCNRHFDTWPEALQALKDAWLEREGNND